jgi:hypothetical protein
MMFTTPLASATHYWSGLTTASDTVNWCYESGLPTSWKNAYFAAANQWNGSDSDWLLYRTSCSSFITGRWDSDLVSWPDVPGYTVLTLNGSNDVTGALSYLNTDRTWDLYMDEGDSMGSSSNQCNPACEPWTIMLHEMGHWVSFDHGGCYTSVMCVDYKVRRFISSHDDSSLVDIYGE